MYTRERALRDVEFGIHVEITLIEGALDVVSSVNLGDETPMEGDDCHEGGDQRGWIHLQFPSVNLFPMARTDHSIALGITGA